MCAASPPEENEICVGTRKIGLSVVFRGPPYLEGAVWWEKKKSPPKGNSAGLGVPLAPVKRTENCSETGRSFGRKDGEGKIWALMPLWDEACDRFTGKDWGVFRSGRWAKLGTTW